MLIDSERISTHSLRSGFLLVSLCSQPETSSEVVPGCEWVHNKSFIVRTVTTKSMTDLTSANSRLPPSTVQPRSQRPRCCHPDHTSKKTSAGTNPPWSSCCSRPILRDESQEWNEQIVPSTSTSCSTSKHEKTRSAMSSINKLSIRGVRSFSPDDEEQVLEFYHPLTVIVGANGCGKYVLV